MTCCFAVSVRCPFFLDEAGFSIVGDWGSDSSERGHYDCADGDQLEPSGLLAELAEYSEPEQRYSSTTATKAA